MSPIKTYVLDTNVLLADPEAIHAFPDGRVVIPETVLGELDKLKTSRADHELRFKGREVSRELFALSEQGKLADGVELEGGGKLAVVGLDPEAELPPEYNARSTDDRILAVAYQLARAGGDVTLVTNDLNMLLKAQAVSLAVQRYGESSEKPWLARVPRQVWQRNRIPILTAVAVLLAFFAVVVLLRLTGGVQTQPGSTAALPPEFERLLPKTQKDILTALQDLERDPDDLAALIQLGNLYYDLGLQQANLTHMQKAITYYERAIAISPLDPKLGTDLASSYYYLGQTDKAIARIRAVLKDSPSFPNAVYNYGIFLEMGKKETTEAIRQYVKVLELVQPGDPIAARAHERLRGLSATRSVGTDG